MFYVLYNSAQKKYYNSEEELDTFDNAERFFNHYDAQHGRNCMRNPGNAKIVGPCKEGEEP